MNATELFFNTIQLGKHENIKLQLNTNPQLVNSKDARGFTPLIFATYFGQDDIAKLLIEHNADIDAKDASGNTALIGVSFKGNVILVSTLLEYGANINAVNNMGTTALIFATIYNKEPVVKLLVDKGADTSIKDKQGLTAYDHAIDKGFVNLLECLK